VPPGTVNGREAGAVDCSYRHAPRPALAASAAVRQHALRASKMTRRRLALVALALLVAALPARAAKPAEVPPDPEASGLGGSQRFEALLDRVKYEQKRLVTLEADFVQEKASEFLAAAETSRGQVSFASPDRVRWEYQSPKPISLLIRDGAMLTWYRDLGRAERIKVGRTSSHIFQYLNASGSLESLLRYFRARVAFPATAEPYRIELAPRFARVAKRLAEMTLWIDRELFLPVRVRYVEPNGDVTEYRLNNLRVNPELDESRFTLDLPAGVEVREIDLDPGRGEARARDGAAD
jgi:outer membrane lipoprotein carrier protein